MNRDLYAQYFLLLCLGASFVLLYFVVRPFLAPLVLAAVFAFLFYPLYRKFLARSRHRTGLAAALTTLAALIVVLVPIALLSTLILREATDVYVMLTEGGEHAWFMVGERALEQVRSFALFPADVEIDVARYTQQALGAVVENLGAIFSSVARMLMNTFVFLMAFYFFLRDGRRLMDYVVTLSPLADADDEMILARLGSAVNATVKGNLTIGAIQGMLTGVGFALFGVPNPVLWGAVTALAALIPGVGTALVLTPAIIFLFLSGNTFGGIGLLLWGVAAVGMVDNILGPRLIGRGMHLHPLAVFLAVLGGLSFFGPLGFFLGPLAMSVCLALIEIYFALQKQELQHVSEHAGDSAVSAAA